MEIKEMKFNERLKALRLRSCLTQKELANLVNVSAVTVGNWELGVKLPSMPAIIALSNVFHVTTDYMLGVVKNQEMDRDLLTDRERGLVMNFRRLDNYGQKAVESLCQIERHRVEHMASVSAAKTHSVKQHPSRYIPRYSTPSAAGLSAPLDGDDFEMILVDSNVPSSADFAVTIQGNSMLPYIHDGETVYVKKTEHLEVGDVGIFSVDGAMYCKQYYIDNEGNLTLVSANPRLRRTNVFVSAEGDSFVKCFGKVLLDINTPLPDYFVKQQQG